MASIRWAAACFQSRKEEEAELAREKKQPSRLATVACSRLVEGRSRGFSVAIPMYSVTRSDMAMGWVHPWNGWVGIT